MTPQRHSGTLGEKENQGTMPKHVAIILDGNRRWAKKNGLKIAERQKIKVMFIGKRENIPASLRDAILEVEEATKSYEGKHLIIALDYSGRFDILQTCKSLAEKAKNGLIQAEEIDEKLMENELMTKCSEFPIPDLLIRTGGEQRISNFFLWQSAYTKLYFPTVLWPEFGKADYLEALTWYQQRERRFSRRFGLRV
ncbi:hypothetical protein DY000_02035471 [Brassica cretica]|uniref:Alkyl transferase n=1 Tax=Brassica cretica TaxID=69181 RepID=A0ABQ7DLQ9_BRACR|nr:hypothetical protein DY000_02035471 [Brassica cretica]